MTFNGLTWGDGLMLALDDDSEVTGLDDLPDPRTGDVPRGRGDGSVDGPMFFADRIITVPLLLLDDPGMPTLIGQLKAATTLRTHDQLTWDFGDGERTAFVRCERRSMPKTWEQIEGVARVTIQFVATDPLIYGAQRFGTTGPGSRVGGLGFPTGFPLGFGDVTANSFPTLNEGNVAAPWTARLDGPLSSPTIELLSTGDRLSWEGVDIAEGRSLHLSSASQTSVMDGGTSSRYPGPRRDWFEIPKGSDDIRLTAASGAGSLSMWWMDSYL